MYARVGTLLAGFTSILFWLPHLYLVIDNKSHILVLLYAPADVSNPVLGPFHVLAYFYQKLQHCYLN